MLLGERPRRSNQIKRLVGGVSQQIPTRTLKVLGRDGLVTRTVHSAGPPQVRSPSPNWAVR